VKALHWDGSELKLDADYPSPKLNETTNGRQQTALVQVHLAGICSTDLQILKGYMGFRGVPGHEFAGIVSAGPASLLGKRVVGEINFACGRCDFCARGLGRHCPNRAVMGILNADGAFAEYVAVPVTNIHEVPVNLGDEEAVFAEPLAAAFEILEQVQISPGEEILVIGDGKLGNLCAQALRLTGAKVTLLGKHEAKLKLVKHAGVRTVLLSDYQPRLFDVVVEATGAPAGLELALAATRPRGTLVLKSTIAGKHEISLAPVVINEINLVGSRCGPFPPALQALKDHRVAVTPLIEKIYPLRDGVEAVQHAAKSGARKILLRTRDA
jgi:threonine dehydrogenase-like Zn-dependent dehydrogenase